MENDVLVVIRTGATESLEKLPAHFETILKCIEDYVIYSDMEEEIEGHHIHGVLAHVDDTIKSTVPEFELYNQLHTKGRDQLDYQTTFGSGPGGSVENPSWKLDKWKFLPMVDRALQHRPHIKWFVFIEPDTYLMWRNMLEYLVKFDANQPYYLGKHMYIGDVLFGHGGSGFALSNPAAKKVVEHWKAHQAEYDKYTEEQWAGDRILGKVCKDVGIDMFWAFPHLQGDSLTTIDWNVSKLDRELWCYVPTTFHHMNKEEFNTMWNFEQELHRRNQDLATLHFQDIFKGVIYRYFKPERSDWDNLSAEIKYSEEATAKLSEGDKNMLSEPEREAHFSFGDCQRVCESVPSCIQFSYVPGRCSISSELRLGHAVVESRCLEYSNAAGKCIKTEEAAQEDDDINPEEQHLTRSGWLMDRASEYVKELDQSCDSLGNGGWVT